MSYQTAANEYTKKSRARILKDRKGDEMLAAWDFAKQVARMTRNGDRLRSGLRGDRTVREYFIDPDDAPETLNALIGQARNITGAEPDNMVKE
jgi:hypothetical protein